MYRCDETSLQCLAKPCLFPSWCCFYRCKDIPSSTYRPSSWSLVPWCASTKSVHKFIYQCLIKPSFDVYLYLSCFLVGPGLFIGARIYRLSSAYMAFSIQLAGMSCLAERELCECVQILQINTGQCWYYYEVAVVFSRGRPLGLILLCITFTLKAVDVDGVQIYKLDSVNNEKNKRINDTIALL